MTEVILETVMASIENLKLDRTAFCKIISTDARKW